jgi:hypothetical protein
MIKRNVLFNEEVTPTHIRVMLPSILDKRASMALMTMPRLDEENRMKNDNFVICLKCKLRLRSSKTSHAMCANAASNLTAMETTASAALRIPKPRPATASEMELSRSSNEFYLLPR